MPSCTINPPQQNPQDVANTFYASLPSGTFWPMFIFATLATVVASQALISAVFSIIMQAISQVCIYGGGTWGYVCECYLLLFSTTTNTPTTTNTTIGILPSLSCGVH